MQVPPELNFNQLQSKAFFSVYKEWPIQPISNGGQYWPGQVVRIFFNALTQGVMDPYRSHIQITVSCDVSTLPVGLLQVDNSAQSFINQIVISSNNRQIQRIVQYGVLAAYLTDMGLSELYTEGREVQGLGYSNLDNYQNIYTCASYQPGAGLIQQRTSQGDQLSNLSSSSGMMPTIPMRAQTALSWGDLGVSQNLLAGVYRSHLGWQNTAWISQPQNAWWWYQFIKSDPTQPSCTDSTRLTSLAYYGYVNNIRAEYLANHMANDYVDTNNTYCKQQLHLDIGVQNNVFPAQFSSNFNGGHGYTVNVPDKLPYMLDIFGQPSPTYSKAPNSAYLFGFTHLYSPLFAKGVREPFISPTVPQCQMQNGNITKFKIPVSKKTFKIPLYSSVIGLGIPQNQFVLIPLRALNNLLIELTIDPYAMFTSGYNDIAEFDSAGMGLMQQRAFKVNKIVYNLHTYQFYNPEMDQYLRVSLSTGIAINTNFWQLGNQYQIQNSQSLTNSWPVACNQQALGKIVTLFVPLDYQNLSFCRKHFRLSNNITKLQLRINMDYFPSQPLTGNGGNPVQLDSSGDNSVFLQQLYQSEGFAFSTTKSITRINAYNFAINQRCYDVTNTNTLYDPTMINNVNFPWDTTTINYDTAMGMSNVHENRYVGKAAYLFSFQPYNHSKDFLTGIDCRAAKSFDIIFSCNPDSWFTRPQTMYIYTCSSVIMEYTREGIVNVNK